MACAAGNFFSFSSFLQVPMFCVRNVPWRCARYRMLTTTFPTTRASERRCSWSALLPVSHNAVVLVDAVGEFKIAMVRWVSIFRRFVTALSLWNLHCPCLLSREWMRTNWKDSVFFQLAYSYAHCKRFSSQTFSRIFLLFLLWHSLKDKMTKSAYYMVTVNSIMMLKR